MNQDKHPILEANFPLDYRTDVVAQIFANIKKAESFSFIGIKDNCKVNVLRFVSQRRDVQQNYLGNQVDNYLYIMVDLNELAEVSLLGFYHLFASSLVEVIKDTGGTLEYLNQLFIDNPTLVIKALKEDLGNIANKTKKQLVIIFNNFDLIRKLDLNLIYHQLIALRNAARFRITYIFTGTRPFEPNTIFFRKFVYMTPFSGQDALGVVNRNCKRYEVALTESQKKLVITQTGGHAGMIKFVIQNLVGVNRDDIICEVYKINRNPDVCFQCERILEPLTELEKAKLKAGEKDELLINLGLQLPCLQGLTLQAQQGETLQASHTTHTHSYKVFSPTLQSHLQEKSSCLSPLVLDVENDEIYLWGKPLKHQLAIKEYQLLTMLLDQPNKIIPREEIMNTVWGRDEFPSDWAFDKLISRLRDKLGDNSGNQRLVKTYRKQGVGLVS